MSPPRTAPPTSHDARERPIPSRRAFLGGTAAAGLATLAGCIGGGFGSNQTEEHHDEFDLASGTLRVDADVGTVSVRPNADPVVTVDSTKSASGFGSIDDLTVTASRSGNAVVVESRLRSGILRVPPHLDLAIRIPSGVSIESIDVRNGGIEAEDVAAVAGAPLRSSNGGVTARGVTGDVSLNTSNGAVLADGVDGFVTAASSNGAVTIRGGRGIDDVTTSNGAIDVDVTRVRGNVRVGSSNGRIDAHLAPSLDARVSAHTSNGTLDVQSGLLADATVGTTDASGTIGDGTYALRVETSNGAISLTRLG